MFRLLVIVFWMFATIAIVAHGALPNGGVQYHGKVSDQEVVGSGDNSANELIFGGSKAPNNLRKRMARSVSVTRKGDIFSCTASVLSNKFILGAAHCFIHGSGKKNQVWAKKSYVLIGEKTTDIRYSESPKNKYKIKQVFVIKNYKNNGYFRNDVALVQLKGEIDDSLYFPMTLGDAPSSGPAKVFAAGYGIKGSNKGFPKKLQMTKMLYQDWDACIDEIGFSDQLRLDESICSSSIGFPSKGKTGICFGDSGGPMMTKTGGIYTQFGINSHFYGDLCESKGAVFVFQRVSFFQKRIESKVYKNKNKGWRKLK